MSKEYQVEKAIMPGSFMEEEFLQMIDFEGVSNYVLGYVDYPYEVYRTPLYALHGTYGIKLYCPISPWVPTNPSKVFADMALSPSPKIKMSFTFYPTDFINRGYILFILVGPSLPGMDAFTATIKIDGSDKKIYVKDMDGIFQEVATISGFVDSRWYRLSATLDIIKQTYSKIKIGWVSFENIDVKYETSIPAWYFPGVEIQHWGKATFESEIGIDNIIVQGVS